MRSQVSIKLVADIMVDHNGYSYLPDVPVASGYFSSAAVARKHLAARAEAWVKEKVVESNNNQRRMIVTVEGLVLLVEYRLGAWGYAICRQGGLIGGGCSMPSSTFLQVVEAARAHAAQSYGGVHWEAS